jgi:hypothetical protein
MTAIYQLSGAEIIEDGDQFVIFSLTNGDTRKVSTAVLLAYINEKVVPGSLETQYAAPSATGFSVTVSANTHLLLTPVAGYAAGTIILPAGPTDRDEFLCNSTQAVTTLTINGNGKGVVGGPATLAANAFFRLKYDGVVGNWYRIG